ncbi:putative anion transporter [Dorcoceras hygrometricum]|uniref:Putative anion transporter n=1 Tax=Dorcoceras hygrometricum TaxID=472368 RepID=A0A2Z7AC35_9LAMI|nr:putative anion transporter [Dorcoceras hygrometricum]
MCDSGSASAKKAMAKRRGEGERREKAAEEQKLENREAINTKNNSTCINIHRVFQACYLAGSCAWLQPVFQEPGASRLIAVVTSIRSTTRFETPSSDCTRSPDEISTIGFSTKN